MMVMMMMMAMTTTTTTAACTVFDNSGRRFAAVLSSQFYCMDKCVIKLLNLIYTQLYSPFEKAAQLYTHKNESEHLTNQQHETLKKKRYLAQSTQST